jgi:hypothetical protein
MKLCCLSIDINSLELDRLLLKLYNWVIFAQRNLARDLRE